MPGDRGMRPASGVGRARFCCTRMTRAGAERIARFQGGAELDDYLADDVLRTAVERRFEIIGEAFAGLRRADPALAAAIPDLPHIVGFRKILVHGYATVDHRPAGRCGARRGGTRAVRAARSRRVTARRRGEALMVQWQRRRAVRPSRSAAGRGAGGGAEAAPRSAGAIRPAPAGAEAAA